jgi:hypothetical protein
MSVAPAFLPVPPFSRAATIAAGVGLLAASCVFPHEMELAGPAGSPCPAVPEAPAVDAPPDTTVVRWYRPTEDRDQELAGAVCRDLGPPVFVATPSGPFPDWGVGDSLTVLSWQMREGEGDLVRLLDSELGLRCEEPRAGLRSGFPPFVLLLQGAVRAAVDRAATCGLAVHFVASDRDGAERGNAILSTLPLRTPVAIDLPLEARRAVAVAATVGVPGGDRLRVASAHVDGLSTLTRTLMGGNQVRARQVSGLVEGLDRADDDGPLNAATLVGADLAVWDDGESAVRLMRDAFPESPAWDGRPTSGPFSRDHLFFRRGSFLTITVGSYARLDDDYGSGHHGRKVVVNYFPVRGG